MLDDADRANHAAVFLLRGIDLRSFEIQLGPKCNPQLSLSARPFIFTE